MALGRLDEAEEQLQRVEAVVRDPTPAQRLDLWRYSQHLFHTYGALWLVRGDTDQTLKLTERCLELAEPWAKPQVRLEGEVPARSGLPEERQARGIRGRAQDCPRERPPARQPASAVEVIRRPRRPSISSRPERIPREKRGWKRSPSSRGWLPTSRTPRWQTHCCDPQMLRAIPGRNRRAVAEVMPNSDAYRGLGWYGPRRQQTAKTRCRRLQNVSTTAVDSRARE